MHEDDAIFGQQVFGKPQPLIHELQPSRVPVAVRRVEKTVVVDEVFSASVVGRIKRQQLDLAGMGTDEVPQGVVVVALNDEVAPGGRAARQGRVQFKAHEVSVQGLVGLYESPLPHQAVRGLTIAALEQLNECFAAQVFVFAGHADVFYLLFMSEQRCVR